MQLPAISIDPALPQRQGVSLLGSTDENSNTTNDSVTAPRLGRAEGPTRAVDGQGGSVILRCPMTKSPNYRYYAMHSIE
jgi:hypothetical protein